MSKMDVKLQSSVAVPQVHKGLWCTKIVFLRKYSLQRHQTESLRNQIHTTFRILHMLREWYKIVAKCLKIIYIVLYMDDISISQ